MFSTQLTKNNKINISETPSNTLSWTTSSCTRFDNPKIMANACNWDTKILSFLRSYLKPSSPNSFVADYFFNSWVSLCQFNKCFNKSINDLLIAAHIQQ